MKDNAAVFIDTNILVYGIYGSGVQQKKVNAVLQSQSSPAVISTQVLKEFTNVCLKKKLHQSTSELKTHLWQLKKTFAVAEIAVETIVEAIVIQEKYKYSFYDSLIIASALENNCPILYSEDLQHGQTIRRVLKIVNPFR